MNSPLANLTAPSAARAFLPAMLTTRPCAIVASGTSRFLVLRGDDLQTEESRRCLAADLMGGRGPSMGLGDQHYQANKVVIVDDPIPGQTIGFRFYQVSVDSSRVYSGMECSNAAPAAAVWAKLQAGWSEAADGSVPTINLGTRQAIELELPRTSPWWQGDWGVRFTALGQAGGTVSQDAEPFVFREGNQAVAGHIVKHGNVFVLAAVPLATLTTSLIARLAALGDDYQQRTGPTRSITKVLAYQPLPLVDDTMVCEAACYSSGQRHHSLPGSAAMTLNAFLAEQGLTPVVSTGPARGESRVRLIHPSGSMTVRADLGNTDGAWRVVATAFQTPVRLLLAGTAVV